jgi:hypothetical protein
MRLLLAAEREDGCGAADEELNDAPEAVRSAFPGVMSSFCSEVAPAAARESASSRQSTSPPRWFGAPRGMVGGRSLSRVSSGLLADQLSIACREGGLGREHLPRARRAAARRLFSVLLQPSFDRRPDDAGQRWHADGRSHTWHGTALMVVALAATLYSRRWPRSHPRALWWPARAVWCRSSPAVDRPRRSLFPSFCRPSCFPRRTCSVSSRDIGQVLHPLRQWSDDDESSGQAVTGTERHSSRVSAHACQMHRLRMHTIESFEWTGVDFRGKSNLDRKWSV